MSFRASQRIETAYRTAMEKLFRSVFPSPKSADLVDELHGLATSTDLAESAHILAQNMVAWTEVENARTWREASRRSQHSKMLYNALQREMHGSLGLRMRQLTAENAALIRSLPVTVAQHLTHEVMRAQQQGSRPETIAKVMQERYRQLSANRIHLIARTETAKASSALTQARSEDLGLDWFLWLTSEDQRVRHSHAKMDDVLMSWNDLPSPEALDGIRSSLGKYGPGQAPNCRCYPEPLLHVNDIAWPHKVYTAGRIVRMSKGQFLRIAGVHTGGLAVA